MLQIPLTARINEVMIVMQLLIYRSIMTLLGNE